jgi:hypothetical protein
MSRSKAKEPVSESDDEDARPIPTVSDSKVYIWKNSKDVQLTGELTGVVTSNDFMIKGMELCRELKEDLGVRLTVQGIAWISESNDLTCQVSGLNLRSLGTVNYPQQFQKDSQVVGFCVDGKREDLCRVIAMRSHTR